MPRTHVRDLELAVIDAVVAYRLKDGDLWAVAQAVDAYLAHGPDALPERPADTGSTTSAEAADSVSGRLGGLRRQIWFEIHTSGGLTTDQIEHRLNGAHQTISPRITELRAAGWIYGPAGRRRKTRTGRYAQVWQVTAAARQQMGV